MWLWVVDVEHDAHEGCHHVRISNSMLDTIFDNTGFFHFQPQLVTKAPQQQHSLCEVSLMLATEAQCCERHERSCVQLQVRGGAVCLSVFFIF